MSTLLKLGAVALVLVLLLLWFRRERLSGRERLLVVNWLVCYDCRAELDSVRVLAGRKSKTTVRFLSRALLEGPDRAEVDEVRDAFEFAFVRDSNWRVEHQLPVSPLDRAGYVATGAARHVGGYRTRAAIALGSIGDSASLVALDSALNLRLDGYLLRAVRHARDSLPRLRSSPRPP